MKPSESVVTFSWAIETLSIRVSRQLVETLVQVNIEAHAYPVACEQSHPGKQLAIRCSSDYSCSYLPNCISMRCLILSKAKGKPLMKDRPHQGQ